MKNLNYRIFAIVSSIAVFLNIFAPIAVRANSANKTFTETSELKSQQMEIVENKIIEAQRRELREMWNKHPVEIDNIYKSNFSAFKINEALLGPDPGFTGIGSTGDILIALDSITDHVGIVVDRYIVIEAHPDNPNGGVDYRDNNWKTRYNRIKGLYVKGASSREGIAAVDYCKNQIGEPYNMLSGRWTEDEWYCSKLVWRGWYEQGYDLEGRTYEPRGTHVTPGDILDSPLTVVFYDYNN